MELVISIVITLAELGAIFYIAQTMGGRGILIASPPANTDGLVVKRGGSKEEGKEGGNIIDVVHSIPGKVLVKTNPDDNPMVDAMDWYYKLGVEPRDWLYDWFGLIWIGLYQTIMKVKVRTFRFGREDEQTEYGTLAKTSEARWIHNSGEHDFKMQGVETVELLGGVNLHIGVPTEIVFPVRFRLKKADPFAFFTMIIRKAIITAISKEEIEKVSRSDPDAYRRVSDAILEVQQWILDETGIKIGKPIIHDISQTAEAKTVLELMAVAERKGNAKVKEAELRKQEIKLNTDAEEDRIIRTVDRKARNEYTTRVTESENLRDSKITHNVNVKVG